ncbi:aldehyde dehydrogenase family protein [Ruegeria sp. HKCCD4884]|uniref:aldehyde dehydrogenase (NADP(+)) n=1 Tax=Ruegeria sp. HKCCD4884 TaxID=2683022 RepID=UPI001492C19E|nr:aldehyde dehydrogenase (NADP(+)) [Ruegeria sp. HKCCD4884]NOD92378.1 aldehyde dehydrogenase family protein [Ruegeria sp. HKCCD4884]
MNGHSLIAGEWMAGNSSFQSAPATGTPRTYSAGTPELVARACAAAEDAFSSYGYSTREDRAVFLERVADEIEKRGADITEIGCAETGLPAPRMEGERGRTTGQLRLFASHIRDGAYLDYRRDAALPDRQPLPRPDLKMVQRPIGPVAVFGASNFPLAFSTAGGDTAAALAAGCPVVVKGHPAHPGTGEIVAEAIDAAREALSLHPGVFSFVQDGGVAVGGALVQNPFIKAVGFTGSLRGGRALFDLCAAREEPIPFFGELGSVNPMFLLPAALKSRGAEIAQGWAASLTMGAGQFCTNPGLAIVPDGPDAQTFITEAAEAIQAAASQTMLTDGIAQAFRDGRDRIASAPEVTTLVSGTAENRDASAFLYQVSAEAFEANPDLSHEVFGPLGLVVVARDADAFTTIARTLEGQLTATVHMDSADVPHASILLPILERKAGRVLFNGFPTGVEVADSMVHGGPYPASTNFGATSVGTLSIRRFLRPVCYQNVPEEISIDI